MGKVARQRPQRLAEKLRQLRTALGLTQRELTTRLALDPVRQAQYVSFYETGKHEPDLLMLLKYAQLAQLPLEQLVDDELTLTLPTQESTSARPAPSPLPGAVADFFPLLPPSVDAVAYPRAWFVYLKNDSPNKPFAKQGINHAAILLLSDLMARVSNPATRFAPEVVLPFIAHEPLVRLKYEEPTTKYRLPQRRFEDALDYLREKGLLNQHIILHGPRRTPTNFIELLLERIRKISLFPDDSCPAPEKLQFPPGQLNKYKK